MEIVKKKIKGFNREVTIYKSLVKRYNKYNLFQYYKLADGKLEKIYKECENI